MIAALFVATGGVYFGLEGVDPWDERRDARMYAGPYAVVAHPPCERWGQYATGGPNPRAQRRTVGDDGGCFRAAYQAVCRYGGVIEHPRGTKAWAAFGIPAPPSAGSWIAAGRPGTYTCCVAQGHYGHPAQKFTWLFTAGIPLAFLPELRWGPTPPRKRVDTGYRSTEHARADRARPDYVPLKRLSKRERVHTPTEFRDMLISLARHARAA